jgi:hypothetical protein
VTFAQNGESPGLYMEPCAMVLGFGIVVLGSQNLYVRRICMTVTKCLRNSA